MEWKEDLVMSNPKYRTPMVEVVENSAVPNDTIFVGKELGQESVIIKNVKFENKKQKNDFLSRIKNFIRRNKNV